MRPRRISRRNQTTRRETDARMAFDLTTSPATTSRRRAAVSKSITPHSGSGRRPTCATPSWPLNSMSASLATAISSDSARLTSKPDSTRARLVRLERGNGQPPLYCAVWQKPRQPIDRDSLTYDCGRDRNWYESKQSPSRVQDDVRLATAPSATPASCNSRPSGMKRRGSFPKMSSACHRTRRWRRAGDWERSPIGRSRSARSPRKPDNRRRPLPYGMSPRCPMRRPNR